MSRQRHQLQEKIFTAALGLPAAERAAFLRHACAGDLELLHSVEALLRAHEESAGFLEHPPEPELAEAAFLAGAPTPEEGVGTRIGRYELQDKIGEGGCGVVYRAAQQEPVRRLVALKIIKLGMDTKSVVARFEAERQALALMDHPNIARALDAGATATGRPFFVMELVDGVRITDSCDQHGLTLEERLRLFIQVCHAVQHAHQKGIIHRDLKPSNILVAASDGGPAPKVIDFGIAKATQGRLTDHTVFTAFEQFIGTPAYMSPEQAERAGLDVDTRSDIYSLGVLLYELLTGRTPLDTPELLRLGVDEVRRRICETEPVRPSARVRTLEADALRAIAARRGLEPARLADALNGDLDWIVMRCLEKDRTRRYETVNGLARDLERHLRNEPVQARPPGRIYVLRKFVRRHRLAFVAGGAVAGALLAGVAVSTVLFLREKAARERAVRAEELQSNLRRQAEANAGKAQSEAVRSAQVARFMEDMLKGVGPSVARGRDTVLMREILDATAQRLDRELQDQPALQAGMRETLGDVYAALGELTRAEEMQQAVLAADRRLYGGDDLSVAAALNKLGGTLTAEGKPIDAEKCHTEALAIQRKRLGEGHRATAGTLVSLAQSILAQSLTPVNRRPEAEAAVREALAIERKGGGVAGVGTLTMLGNVMRHDHRYAEGEAVFREALARDPDNDDILSQLGDVLTFTRKLPEAEAILRRALGLQLTRLNEGNPQIGATQNELANALRLQGKFAEAESVGREAVALKRRLLAREPANKDFMHSLAQALNKLGSALFHEGRFVEAEKVDREALALHETAVGNVNREGVDCLHQVGDDLLAQDRLGEAEDWFRNALKVEEEILDERVADSIRQLITILNRQQRSTDQDPFWAETLAAAQPTLATKNPTGSAYVGALVSELVANGKFAEAEPLIRGHLARLEKLRPDYWYVFAFRYQLGGVLAGQKRFAEAEPLLLAGFAGLEERRRSEIPNRSQGHLLYAAGFLAKLYRDWGKPDEAAEWERKFAELRPEIGP